MRVLLFSPHAGIWVHAFPEALVADAVRDAGAQLVYITCNGALADYCVTFSAHGLSADSPTADKQAVCAKCRAARDRLRSGFELPGYDFESVLEPADRARIDDILATVRPDAVTELVVDGYEVGRAALYEFLIERKKLALELTADDWRVFRPRIANALRSLFAAERICERERPDRVIVYNSLYSVNAVWRAVANRRGIPFYFVHGGLSWKTRLRRVIVGRDSTIAWGLRMVDAWPRYREIACTPAELSQITDHYLQLFRGTSKFVYSAPKAASAVDVRARFGVGEDQKLIVATMSSYDEYVAAATHRELPDQSTLLFPTQIEWVRALSSWMHDHPELFLVLRVHPREFPNKREGTKSEHAVALERELAQLPPNVRVNWPAEQLSLYDLAEHTDVFLNAWSSAGKEMALLGLPVVTYCPTVLLYTPELNYAATTRASYFAAIESALRDGWSFERIRAAYRWNVLELVRAIADISDGFDVSEERGANVVERARNLLFAIPAVRQQRDLWRRPDRLAEQRRIGDLVLSGKTTLLAEPPPGRDRDRETAALRIEIGRLMRALYPNSSTSTGPLRARLASAATSE